MMSIAVVHSPRTVALIAQNIGRGISGFEYKREVIIMRAVVKMMLCENFFDFFMMAPFVVNCD